MKTVLLPTMILAGVCAVARPLAVSEFKNRYEATGETAHAGQPLDITGQVMFASHECPRRLTLQDRSQPQSMSFLDIGTNASYRSGDILRVWGICTNQSAIADRQSPLRFPYCLTNFCILGHAAMPVTCAATAEEVNAPTHHEHFIHVDGVLSSAVRDTTNAGWNWMQVRTDSGTIRAAATETDYPIRFLQNLLDAEVRVSGIVHDDYIRQMFKCPHLVLFGTNGLAVTRPAPLPFDAPRLQGDRRLAHRQRIEGIVVGSSQEQVFIRDDRQRFIPISTDLRSWRPKAGEQIEASGFVDTRPMTLRMSGALLRPSRRTDILKAEDQPMRVEPNELFMTEYGDSIADLSRYGRLIRLSGRIANSTDSIRTDGRILIESGMRSVSADVRHLRPTLDKGLSTDCLVDVTGICLLEFDADAADPLFPRLKGFVLVPRAADDIVIVRRPPWWTPLRLLCVIAFLMLALVAFALWNRMLKVLSERRGRELAKEQIVSAKADLKVEERTRLAIELHDSISQTLTGVALQIDAATRTGRANPSAAEKFLKTARTMLSSCRQELRCCIWDLKSRTFDERDMTEAVQKTLAPHIDDIELTIRFNVPRTTLSDSAAHDTLRIIRELAVNALRHGHARHLRVAGEYKDGFVRFSVRDDGTGFDPADVPGPADGHFGLQGIRERIKDRNGELHIESAVGQGTKITVSLMANGKDEDDT